MNEAEARKLLMHFEEGERESHRKAINLDQTYPSMSKEENQAHHALMEYIANECIINNLHRAGNDFHQLNVPKLNAMFFRGIPHLALAEAYCFLDEDGGNEGMIRLYPRCGGNPKYSFGVNDSGEIEYGGA